MAKEKLVKTPIFSAADVLLPPFQPQDKGWTAWATIACDQFTSEPAYWASVKETVGDRLSTYRLFLPEAYLGTAEEVEKIKTIPTYMASYAKELCLEKDVYIYLERTLPDGRIRRGIVGKIDLEAYDYAKGSVSPVRATEATVLERIPPRKAIRASATLELPHIMILVDDREKRLISPLAANKDGLRPLYDFDLMLGGGHVSGYCVEGKAKKMLDEAIASYEAAQTGRVVYAMGDGNHSLAAAKAFYESLKEEFGEKALNHPARYALCEIVALQDEALVFEPIYRLVKNVNAADFLSAMAKVTAPGNGEQTVTIVYDGQKKTVHFTERTHALTVGTLQNLIDDYLKSHPGVQCDYIHDEASLEKLCEAPDAVGILLDVLDKSELFPYVAAHGTLPRKTFSMGEARSKRYYLEVRKITKGDRNK